MGTDSGALAGWFNRKQGQTDDDEEAATSGVTAHDDDHEPVVVWEAANRMEAVVVAGRLHSEGIPAMIRGEVLGDIYGLTYGSLAASVVLVPKLLAAGNPGHLRRVGRRQRHGYLHGKRSWGRR